ncbi:MAG TPA: hypothetical protein VLR46_08565 [Candidatus Dormibacteraeota bacterium]|nr:hypothetical protein [Candidatus Dormibacteraeota bacterium]
METIKATSETIACTLTEDQHAEVEAAWRQLFQTALLSRDLVPGGLRLTVAAGAESELRRLIEIEGECCGWVDFAIEGPSVTMTAQGNEGEQAIQAMWGAGPIE